MPSAMSIHFESDHPFIAVPLECETIEDLQDRIDEILKKPYDMIAFDAGCFNGTINLSQLWNALLFIARDAEQPSVLFSCDKSKLPEMYQTDNDYATILRFAIRSALIDAVKIEGSLDEDDIDDIAGQAVDLGMSPSSSSAPTRAPKPTNSSRRWKAAGTWKPRPLNWLSPSRRKKISRPWKMQLKPSTKPITTQRSSHILSAKSPKKPCSRARPSARPCSIRQT